MYRISFYMGQFKSRTPKLTKLWSSSPAIAYFRNGRFPLKAFKEETRLERERSRGPEPPPPCRNYQDGAGNTSSRGLPRLRTRELRLVSVESVLSARCLYLISGFLWCPILLVLGCCTTKEVHASVWPEDCHFASSPQARN